MGTHEFVDFCQRVNAEPMYCVNFLGDGEKRYQTMPEGNRTGDAREAADWVSYTNDPDHVEIKANGQFDVVWKTPGLVPGAAWSPILDDSKNLKADWTKPVNCGNFDTVANKCIGKTAAK